MIIILVAACGGGNDGGERRTIALPGVCSNPSSDHIEYFGYYVVREFDYHDVRNYTNSFIFRTCGADLDQLEQIIDEGNSPFIECTASNLFLDYGSDAIKLIAWEMLVGTMEPYLDDIAGFYIIDEPLFHDMCDEELEWMVNKYREHFPNIPLWVNFSYHYADRPIPVGLDYISLTPGYNTMSGAEYDSHLDMVRANMHAGQQMILILDGYHSAADISAVPEHIQEYKADTLQEYFELAKCDENIIGMLMYAYYSNVDFANAAFMPILQDEMQSVWDEIIKE